MKNTDIGFEKFEEDFYADPKLDEPKIFVNSKIFC